MKKIMKAISLCLVFIFSLITFSGCSCDNKISVQYSVKLNHDSGLDEKNIRNTTVNVITYQKYRDIEEVEHNKPEKKQISIDEIIGPLAKKDEEFVMEYTSDTFGNSSDNVWLVFEIIIGNISVIGRNNGGKAYIKAFNAEEIIGDELKDECDKIIITPPGEEFKDEEDDSRYVLKQQKEMTLTIEVKKLDKDDFVENIEKILKLNINIHLINIEV